MWARGFVYLGEQLLAIRANGTVYYSYEDPLTKARKLTSTTGRRLVRPSPTVTAARSRRGRGCSTPRSSRRFTTYGRDANGSDEAMYRRYSRSQARFEQPDPYQGSYVLTNPQSFNRYSYVRNDPVNFVDPTGLLPAAGYCAAGSSFEECYGSGGGGGFWGGGWDFNDRPLPGGGIIRDREEERYPFIIAYWDPWDRGTALPFVGFPQTPTCEPLTQRDIYIILRNMRDLLEKPLCSNFMKGVLEELGKHPQGVYSNNMMTIFNAVRAQGNGGIFRDMSQNSWGYAFGSLERGNATIAFRSLDGGTGLHETLHVAAKTGYGYSHQAMAQAALTSAQAMGIRVVGNLPNAGDYAKPADFDNANSLFFERIFFDACKKE